MCFAEFMNFLRESDTVKSILRRLNNNNKEISSLCQIVGAVAVIIIPILLYQMNASLQQELNKPQIRAQLTSQELPWGHWAKDYRHKIYRKDIDHSIQLPVFLKLYNHGNSPAQLINVGLKAMCGDEEVNRGLLSINPEELLNPGSFQNYTDEIIVSMEKNPDDCIVYFYIYGFNFDTILKTITIEVIG